MTNGADSAKVVGLGYKDGSMVSVGFLHPTFTSCCSLVVKSAVQQVPRTLVQFLVVDLHSLHSW